MKKNNRILGSCSALVAFATSLWAQDPEFKPRLIEESDLTVLVEEVGTMPFVLGPGFFGPAPNIASPVPIGNKLYLIDQNDAIYQLNRRNRLRKVLSVDEAPDGLVLDNRHSFLNVSAGRRRNSIYVMFTSATLPSVDIPVYELPAPLPGVCCSVEDPQPVDDLYRLGMVTERVNTRTEYQVLYEYKIGRKKLIRPRAIAAIESQSGPAQHNGGGMLTAPDGRVLFATGDALSSGLDGRFAPQEDQEVVGKILLINPRNGDVEVAAKGFRNVQRLDYVDRGYRRRPLTVGFVDIGGFTAEEVNFVSARDLLDTSKIENFGWGRNADGLAREGTFYVGPGVALVGPEPQAVGIAPTPDPGFIQPYAQYGRDDPNSGNPTAISGPVSSRRSFYRIRTAYTNLASGILYASLNDLRETDVTVFRVNLINENGEPLDSFRDLLGGRADPRLFRFPDGSAGVLLERNGTYYRLTELWPHE